MSASPTGAGVSLDDVVEQAVDALAGLRADPEHVVRVAADQAGQLRGVLLRVGAGQVDLVEHRDDVQVGAHREVEVRQRLRLDALRGVDQQDRGLAGLERAGDLVGEVDVAGGVDHVEHVGAGLGALGVVRRNGPRHPHGLALDGDAALALDVHPVEVLRAGGPGVDDAGQLQHPVGERRLAVVDVRDDAEVADDRRVGLTRRGRGVRGHRRLSVKRNGDVPVSHRTVRGPASARMCAVSAVRLPTTIPHGRTARRLEWPHLPPHVRAVVEQRCGSPVATAQSQGAGFTPGFASVLTCADGTRHFVKAASLKAQRMFAEAYREEARKLAALPAGAPAPRLLWTHDADDWVVLGDRVRRRASSPPARGGPPTSTLPGDDRPRWPTRSLPRPTALALPTFADGVRRLAGVLGPAARRDRPTCPGWPSTSTRRPRSPRGSRR